MNQKMTNWLTRILMSEIVDSFYGHRGRPGYRGGSVPKTEHTTKHRNSQFESEAGEEGFSIAHAMKMSKPHKYTAKEHKAMQDRALVLVSGDQIAGSKYGGMQLYRYNKKDKCLECSYGDNPTLSLKDLKGKEVRTFQPTSDVVNKDTIHAVKKKRISVARKETEKAKLLRLKAERPKANFKQEHAVSWYTTNTGFSQMNNALRAAGAVNVHNGEIESMDSSVKDNVDNLSKFLDRSVLQQDTMLYRGCGVHGVSGVFEQALKSMGLEMKYNNIDQCLKALVGQTGQDIGFMSTSTKKNIYNAKKFHYEIFAPKGSNCAFIGDMSHYKSENEVLAQRGTKMLLTGYRKTKGGKYVLQVQIVN